jgi:hypothetical protein
MGNGAAAVLQFAFLSRARESKSQPINGPMCPNDVRDAERSATPVRATHARQASGAMTRNPVLDLPLNEVMKADIALTLQHILQIYTVGNFLKAWRNPKNHKSIEQVFSSPQEARHAAAICANWLGIRTLAAPDSAIPGWWRNDEYPTISA